MNQHNIRFGGKALGRPRKQTAENAEEIRQAKLQRKQDAVERIPIEGKFGQGKNGYRLNYIRAKTLKTSEAWINSIFFVMNLMVLFRMCSIMLKNTLGLLKFAIFARILTKFTNCFMLNRMIVRLAG